MGNLVDADCGMRFAGIVMIAVILTVPVVSCSASRRPHATVKDGFACNTPDMPTVQRFVNFGLFPASQPYSELGPFQRAEQATDVVLRSAGVRGQEADVVGRLTPKEDATIQAALTAIGKECRRLGITTTMAR